MIAGWRAEQQLCLSYHVAGAKLDVHPGFEVLIQNLRADNLGQTLVWIWWLLWPLQDSANWLFSLQEVQPWKLVWKRVTGSLKWVSFLSPPSYGGGRVRSCLVRWPVLFFISVLALAATKPGYCHSRERDEGLLCFRLFKFIDLEAFWNRFYSSLLHKIQKIRLRRNSCGPQVLTSVWPPHSADMRGPSGCRSPDYIKEILTTETSPPPVRKKPIGSIDKHRYNWKNLWLETWVLSLKTQKSVWNWQCKLE